MGGDPIRLVGAATAAVALGSLFAAGDTALNALPEARLQVLAAEGPRAVIFRRYLDQRVEIAARWMVGRIVTITLAAVLADELVRATPLASFGPVVAVLGAVASYGTLAAVLGALARLQPEGLAATALQILRPFEWLLIPLAAPLAFLGRAVARRVGESEPDAATATRNTKTEVAWLVDEGERTGAIAVEPAEMIRNVLDFKDLTTREVMVSRKQAAAVELSTPLRQVTDFVAREAHSRYPVYRETIDNVVGLLYAKDLFAVVNEGRLETTKLEHLVRSPVLFVAETQQASDVLREMRGRRLHMAIVLDEFGGTSGLVTLEDILEEIVGDIRDEHDAPADAPLQTTADGRLVADGAIPLTDLAEQLGREIPTDGTFESLGGLLVHRAGRVPGVGATLQVDGLKFIVREADGRRVVKVEIVPEVAEKAATTASPVPQP